MTDTCIRLYNAIPVLQDKWDKVQYILNICFLICSCILCLYIIRSDSQFRELYFKIQYLEKTYVDASAIYFKMQQIENLYSNIIQKNIKIYNITQYDIN
jgi:hypothetical protein